MYALWFSNIYPGARALRRDWHSGELRLLILALVIAVAAVTSVGFLADRVGAALERNSAQMLGGDLALQSSQPFTAAFIEQAGRQHLQMAQTVMFPSMASSADDSQLVSLKAVSPGYPLRGTLQVSDTRSGAPKAATDTPAPGTVWVDAQVLGLLGLELGDSLQVGDASLIIARIIAFEPDRGVQFVNMAPRVMMRLDELPRTNLIGPGSRVRYTLLLAGRQETVNAYKDWLVPRLERGQKLSSLDSARPEIQGSLVRAHQFLILVALLTVLIAAVAIALASRRFGLRHQDGIAVMRCLGATQFQLGAMLAIEFFLLAVFAALAGTLIGYGVQQGLASMVAAWFDTPLPAPSWNPAQYGLATGLLLLLGFALPPLAALRRIAPARVLRHDAMPQARYGLAAGVLGAGAFFLLAWWISGDARLSAVVCGGFLLALGLFAAVALGGVTALGQLRYRVYGRPTLRFALAGIARRKSLTVTQVCALSTGLMILLLLAITRTDLLAGWQNTLPANAPNTFLINIQPGQQQSIQARLEQAGLDAAALAPMVRGRLLAINGKALREDMYTDDRARRLVEREFNLSYMDALPRSNSIKEGGWIDPSKSEVSIENGLAQTLGIKLGDTLTFQVAGQPVAAAVSSLREVKWDSFDVNFFAILSPAALKNAPATYITSFHLPAAKAGVMQQLVHAFPNLTVFDVGAILGQVQHILDQVVQAVQLLFLFTVSAGMLVLAAAFYSTRDERMHEVAVLRVLGASARQLSAALFIELLLIGALAGLLAAIGAVSIAWVLADQVFEFPLSLSWWPWPAGIAAGIVAACLGGGIALKGVLHAPPLISLREVV